MLTEFEQLWNKTQAPIVDMLLSLNSSGVNFIRTEESEQKIKQQKVRKDQFIAVTFKAPNNSAVQLYDYKNKASRIVFGPELIMLEPYEEFSLITLSGGLPKKENQIKTLTLNLGPDFMTDIIQVETSDHAKLFLQLSYRWNFKIDRKD